MKFIRLTIVSFFIVLLAIVSVRGQEIKSVRDFGFAESLFEQELYRIAIDAYEKFMFNNPDSPLNANARFQMGKAYMELGDFEMARDAFEEVTVRYKKSPLNSDAWNLLAECHILLGQPAIAAETFEAIADILFADSRYTVPALYRAAEIYAELKNYEKTYGLLYRLTDNYPEHQLYPKAVIRLSGLYAGRGDFIKAIRELTKLENSNVSEQAKWEAMYYRGSYELAVNNITKGEQTLNYVLSASPLDSPIHQKTITALSRHYQSRENFDSADQILESLINLRTANNRYRGEAFLLSGISKQARGKFEEATNSFDQALSMLEDSPQVYRECLYYAAQNAANLEDMDQAYTYLQEMFNNVWLETAPVEKIADFELEAFALFLQTANLVNRSFDIALFSKNIIEKSKMFPGAQTFLEWGRLFSKSSIIRTANALYETGYSLYPEEKGSDFLLLERGNIFELMGDYQLAAGNYEQVIKKFSGGEAAHIASRKIDYINRKYSSLGPEETLLRRLELLDQGQSPDEAFMQAELQFDRRRYDEALRNLRDVIDNGESGKNYADALRYSALIHDNRYIIYSFEKSPILAQREAREAVGFYQNYADNTPDSEFGDSARRRIVDLTISMEDLHREKILRARDFVQKFSDDTRNDAAGYGKFILAGLLINYGENPGDIAEASGILADVESGTNDDGAKEKISYLKVLAGLKLQDDREVVRAGTQYVNDFPDGMHSPEIRFRGAGALFNLDNTSTAMAWIEHLKNHYFYSGYVDSAKVLEADILAKEGKTGEAIKLYRDELVKASESDNPELLASLLKKTGDSYVIERDFVTASDHYNMYISTTEDMREQGAGYRALANAYISQNDLDGAIDALQRIIDLDVDSIVTLNAEIDKSNLMFELAADPLASGYDAKLRAAQSAFTELAQKSLPDSMLAQFEFNALASLYRLDRRTQANNGRKDFENKYKNRRLSFGDLNEYMGLLRVEEGAVHQRNAVKLLSTARQKEADDRFNDAEKIFNDVIKDFSAGSSRQLAEYYLGLQFVAYQDRMSEGLPLLRDFNTKYPDSPYKYMVSFQVGNLFYQFENYKEAFLFYDIAVNTPKGKNDINTHRRYIEACVRAGFKEEQLRALRTYIDHFPNAPDKMGRLISIGILYRDLGLYDLAVSQLNEILQKAGPGEQMEIQYYIGETYREQKKYTLAIAEYLKILAYGDPSSAIGPFDTNARYYIADSFKSIGQYSNAIKYVDEIMNRYGSSDGFYVAARRLKDEILNLMKKKN